MATWDRQTTAAQQKHRDLLLGKQVRDAIRPFSPFWRERFAALRLSPSSISGAADLVTLPAVTERDVCPDGDPRGAARLVLQADEQGFIAHAEGADLRRAIRKRATGVSAYRRHVEAEIRPTTYHWAGRGFTFPVASTRHDLDLVARAGNRAWQVLGLGTDDVLVSAVPVGQRLDHVFLTYAALGAGAPGLFPRSDAVGDAGLEAVARALALVSATVLAVPAAEAADTLAALAGLGSDLGSLRRVLLLGVPSDATRAATVEALAAAGARAAEPLALYGPGEGRVLWPECSPGSGFHTYPDLDIVETVDGEAADLAETGELAVTQLGFRGTALLRWRTGDAVTEPVHTQPCPRCGRTVPRIPAGVVSSAYLHSVALRGGPAVLDLRSVAGVLTGRADVSEWRVELRRSKRDGADELVVFVVPSGDEASAAVEVYRDVRSASGLAATQVVVATPAELAALASSGDALTPRIAVRR